jgi:predicted RNase H-like HicB family nuclease
VLEREAGDYFGLWFPDFPGAVAAGKTQEETMAKAQAALGQAMQARAERADGLPAPTPIEAIELPEDCDFVTFLAVGATPPDPSERVNVYLPRSLIEKIDQLASDWGMTRSSLFGLAATRLLAARPLDPAGMLIAAGRK